MDDALTHLPDDPAALKAIIAGLKSQRDEARLEILRLEVELLRLKKWYYGPRADTLAGQADLAPEVQEGVGADAAKTLRRVKRGRRNLAAFDKLPVTRIVHDLGEGQKT